MVASREPADCSAVFTWPSLGIEISFKRSYYSPVFRIDITQFQVTNSRTIGMRQIIFSLGQYLGKTFRIEILGVDFIFCKTLLIEYGQTPASGTFLPFGLPNNFVQRATLRFGPR